MKKCDFYTMVRTEKGPEAQRVSGYTDGLYNYRKNEFGQWFAIVPAFGLSVAQSNTRKGAAVIAHSKEVKEAVQRYIDNNMNFFKTDACNKLWNKRFLELIAIKEAAEKLDKAA